MMIVTALERGALHDGLSTGMINEDENNDDNEDDNKDENEDDNADDNEDDNVEGNKDDNEDDNADDSDDDKRLERRRTKWLCTADRDLSPICSCFPSNSSRKGGMQLRVSSPKEN